MPVIGKANSTSYTLHKKGDIDIYEKRIPGVLYTTKAWAQGDGGFSWTVPETGWYYLKASFDGEMYGRDSKTHFQSFRLMKQNEGSTTSDLIAYDTTFQYDQTNNLCLDKEVATVLKLKKGTRIFPLIWCGEAGKKFDTALWVVKFGGGTVAHSLFREGGRHGWHNREGGYETNNPGRTGSSGNHQSQTDLSEPGRNLHTGLSDLGIIGTGSGYCVLGNIESLDESATKLLCPRILWSRENPQNGFRTQGRQRCLFTALGDLIGGGLYA